MSIFRAAFWRSAGRQRSAGKRKPITSARRRGRTANPHKLVLSPRARTFPKGSLDLGVSRRSAVAGSGAAKRRGDEVSDSDREHLHRAEQASLSAGADPTADLPSVLGKNLKRQRTRRGYSLERLAALSGVSRAMIGQIESG